MSEASPDSSSLAVALAREARTGPPEHPDSDQLLDYHAGLLSPDAEKSLQDHVVGCRRCMRRLLELEPFAEPELDASGPVADFEVDASLRELEELIRDGRKAPSVLYPRLAYAVAAALAVAAVALAIWVVRLHGTAVDLRQTVDALTRPAVNVAVVYLEPIDSRGADPAPILLPADEPSWVLVLIPRDHLPEYEVILLREDGEEVWQSRGIVMTDTAEGVVNLRLTRRLLPAGRYKLLLHGLDGGRKVPQGDYSLQSP